MSKLHKKQTNSLDSYLLVFIDTDKVYEKFRLKFTAEQFLHKHPLKEELKIIPNPKYQNE